MGDTLAFECLVAYLLTGGEAARRKPPRDPIFFLCSPEAPRVALLPVMKETADLYAPTALRVLALTQQEDKGSALIKPSGSDKPWPSGEFESLDRWKH